MRTFVIGASSSRSDIDAWRQEPLRSAHDSAESVPTPGSCPVSSCISVYPNRLDKKNIFWCMSHVLYQRVMGMNQLPATIRWIAGINLSPAVILIIYSPRYHTAGSRCMLVTTTALHACACSKVPPPQLRAALPVGPARETATDS